MDTIVCNERKGVKKICRWVGFGLLLYTLILYAAVFADMVLRIVLIIIQSPDMENFDAKINAMAEELMKSGLSTSIGVVLGTLFLWLWFYKKVSFKSIFQSGKQMTGKKFVQFLCIFMGGQFVFDYVYQLMEWLLNQIGYTAEMSMDIATSGSTTISMFLYAGIIGPIVEELVYRGFVMRHLEKHGKMFAIVVSAVLFGVMHANIPQGAFAFGVGFILAYVAIEYSVVWSIAIHIFNNLILSDLLGKALENFSEQIQNIVYGGLLGGSFLVGLVILWLHRNSLKQYLVENKTKKKKYLYAFTTVAMILFIGLELLMGIIMLEAV